MKKDTCILFMVIQRDRDQMKILFFFFTTYVKGFYLWH